MKKILLIIATFVFVWSVFVEPSVIRTVKYDVGGFGVNKKIVFISDLHLSKHDARRLARIVNRVNELKPDIVLLGGDYVKWDVSDSIPLEALSAGLARLKAKDGVFAVKGNHDNYYENYASCDGLAQKCKANNAVTGSLKSAGIRVLDNENVNTGGIFIAGAADVKTDLPDLKKAFRGAVAQKTLLLSHSPYIVEWINGNLKPDVKDIEDIPLVLAGHTHGGQVRIPFVGAIATPDGWGDDISYGTYRFDKTLMIVTSGLGTTFLPVRFNCLPEIVVVNLIDIRD